ncbi:MAG: hypothetical protein GXP23_10285 [Gammaproteobacteria bacterium]|nr:hypothetical protein [Gammaproteobacteria bacterium]
MTIWRYTVVMLCALGLCQRAQSRETEFSTTVWSQWAVNTRNGDSQALGLSLKPEFTSRFGNGYKLTAIGRLKTETSDGLQPDDVDRDSYSSLTRPSLLTQGLDAELREFYLEMNLGATYLTLGKQQVVWGEADGLKVLDVVNPQSFREFILEDFDDSRIPLWTVNLERQLGSWDAQVIWILDQTYHALPRSDATYAFTSSHLVPRPPPGLNVNIQPLSRPDRVIRDSDAGLRLSTFWDGWDLTFNYLYQYDNQPVLFQRSKMTATGPMVIVTPKYERTHVFGGTFSNAFGEWVARGEVGYFTNRYFLTSDPSDRDGVFEGPELSYVFGLDWSGLSDTFVSAQIFQSWVPDSPAGMTRNELETTVTFLVRREFLNNTLQAEVLWLAGITDGDGLLRPKVTYEWQDDVKTWIGTDIFYGNRAGLFGEFNDNDRIVMGFELGF